MKASIVSKLVLTASMVATLAACSLKVSGGGAGDPPKATPFAHKVAGPSLDGVWSSGCEVDGWEQGYVMFTMIVNGQNVQRIETKFDDNICSSQRSTLNRQGQFRYVEKYSSDVFEVEYRFNMKGGWYTSGDNIRLTTDSLWISDRRVGNGAYPDIELKLVK